MPAPASKSYTPLTLVPNTGSVEVRKHPRPERWTATIRLPDGSRITLHRADDPLGEARAQLVTCGEAEPRIIAIVGAGLGYLTEAAVEQFPNARIVVLEPLAALAQAARERTPSLYASDRVEVVVGPRFDGKGDLWRLFDVAEPDEPDPALLLNPVLQRAMPAAVTTAVLLVRRATSGARMNARARRDNAGRYVVNTLRNLPHILKGVDPARLVGQFAGVPAVLVAAGPSLDRNIPVLKKFQNNALIVATDTAWRPLVSAGIDPHLVVSLDPSPLNGRHLAGVRSRRETWLLAEGSVDPDALQSFAGRVGTFRVGMHHPWPWLTELGMTRPLAHVWGSVLTAVFDLSVAFACDPLIFIGADLAFTDERPYCRGTTFENIWARYTAQSVSLRQIWHNTIHARPSIIERDVHGNDTATAAHLVEFRNWLVAHTSKQTGRNVINATGGGILRGPGIEQADLASVLQAVSDRGDTIRDTIHRLLELRAVPAQLPAVMNALAAITEANPDEASAALVAQWVEFGRPSLTSGEIRKAAREGQADLDRPWPPLHSTKAAESLVIPDLRLHEADRVARMRSILTKDRSLLEGCAEDTGGTSRSPGAWASDVAYVVTALLSLPRLVTSVDELIANGAVESKLPLSHRFVWTAPAAPFVAALEELLIEGAEFQTSRSASEQTVNDFWSGWLIPVLDDVDQPRDVAGVDDERRIRLELTSLRPGVLECDEASLRQNRLANAISRGLADPALSFRSQAPYRLELVARNAAAPLSLRIDALMRALTGTLALTGDRPEIEAGAGGTIWPDLRAVVEQNAAVEPRLAFLTHSIDFLEPDVLSDRGLPLGYSLVSADDDRVLFTPQGGRSSLVITSDGLSTPASLWPSPITGEIAWGVDGGALAWNSFESKILFRPSADAKTLIDELPFRPVRLAIAPDGGAVWSAQGGDVWRWLPGRESRHILHAPTWGGILFDGEDLVLPPVVRDAQGRVQRQRLTYEWRSSKQSSALRQVDSTNEGQCFGIARRGRWMARAYPFSDLVRLDSVDGATLLLACHAATSVAWAGTSLVVNTGDGIVVLFRDLTGRLDTLCQAPARGTH